MRLHQTKCSHELADEDRDRRLEKRDIGTHVHCWKLMYFFILRGSRGVVTGSLKDLDEEVAPQESIRSYHNQVKYNRTLVEYLCH